MWTIDFETKAIQRRPVYPPEPVGVALKHNGSRGRYLSWGHPEGNNSTFEMAHAALRRAYDSGEELLFHNAKFDLEVATKFFNLPMVPWQRYHDTMFQVFLEDPYARSFALKPSAERILSLLPEERDAVQDWLIEHRVVARNAKDWGAYICEAPADLVGRYAIGDVDRTYALHKHLLPWIKQMGMLESYDRERQVMPILLRNEQQGMRVDADLLAADVARYQRELERADDWLRKKLKTPGLNIDATEDLADALRGEQRIVQYRRRHFPEWRPGDGLQRPARLQYRGHRRRTVCRE